MKILVTGANGQLGRAITGQYQGQAELILTELADIEGTIQLDISDLEAVRKICEAEHPDVIINCAAFTNVDGCEAKEDVAYQANAIGPKCLAIAAEECGAKLVHVSTDYVFSGDDTEPIVETQKPNPVSAYGRTKLAGEEMIMENCHKYFILRTAWLYGDGHNFVKTMINAAKTRDEVSVVCDQLGTPTTALELARAIKYLADTDKYGIYHATCEGDTNWADFTEAFYAACNINCKVNHITSEEYAKMNPNAAKRPAYSILEDAKFKADTDYRMANWQDAMQEYLKANNYFAD